MQLCLYAHLRLNLGRKVHSLKTGATFVFTSRKTLPVTFNKFPCAYVKINFLHKCKKYFKNTQILRFKSVAIIHNKKKRRVEADNFSIIK